mgnify:CR=1 FL=1
MYLTNVIDTNINHGTEFSEHYLPMCMIALTFSHKEQRRRVFNIVNNAPAFRNDFWHRIEVVVHQNYVADVSISIADNIREDAIETIKWFGENDVNVKVISGDNPITVCEVAKRAGIKNADNDFWHRVEVVVHQNYVADVSRRFAT